MGVSCGELRAEWGAQRLRGLTFRTAARNALLGDPGEHVKTLIDSFHYPRLGPGQMWEAMRERVEEMGGEVRTGAAVERVEVGPGRVTAVTADGRRHSAGSAISPLPLRPLA